MLVRQQRVFLLEGAAWYSSIWCYERGGTSLERAAVASLSRFVNRVLVVLSIRLSSFSPFPFSGCLLAVAPAVSLVGCIVWLLYLYSGATAYFVDNSKSY